MKALLAPGGSALELQAADLVLAGVENVDEAVDRSPVEQEGGVGQAVNDVDPAGVAGAGVHGSATLVGVDAGEVGGDGVEGLAGDVQTASVNPGGPTGRLIGVALEAVEPGFMRIEVG